MQKLIKRTAQAEKQVLRRVKKYERQQAGEQKAQRLREETSQLNELNEDVRLARLSRSEKWNLGPLTPRRDAFDSYGALQTNRQTRQSPLRKEEVEARCAWAGGPKHLNLAVKDRVVLLDGHEKGQIDHIASINTEQGTLTLENIAKVATSVPPSYQKILDAPATQNTRMEIPISSVRLVHPLVDPKTGIARDVIIRHLARGPVKWSRESGWRGWNRYVPGANISIPWPERDQPVREDQPDDTKRMVAEEATFVPTLLRPPMPESIIDELRNRYSRFRTRHEEEYVLRKEAEEAQKNAIKKLDAGAQASARSALQEFNRQQRDARRARGEPALSDEMLEKIGRVIARNKARTLSAAGMSEVPPPSEPAPSQPAPQILDAAIPPTGAGPESHPPPQ